MITVPALYVCGYCGVTTTSECGFCSKACRVDELLEQPLIHPAVPRVFWTHGPPVTG